ncbi:MAG: hypothetical protein L6R37_007898 [Teloschistes peruensis]|nr:MAG: hypothetical protein L6R37_007898 [Teloschistes peruensis]
MRRSAAFNEVDNEDSDDIVVSDPQGWLIVPSDLPADINFVATTIGSFTSCRNGTQLCDLAFTPAYTYNYTYNCKRDIAGLDLVANMSTADDGPVLVYYADSTMNTPAGDIDLQGPTLWYAVLLSNSRNDGSEILACSTELSDVEYSYTNGLHTLNSEYTIVNRRANSIYGDISSSSRDEVLMVNSWTAMKSSSSFAFVSAMGEAWASSAQLQRTGILSYSAQSNATLASEWASTYDQTMLHTGNGMLVVRDPVRVGHSLVAQVTRIPRAPLLTLIILDLLYALVGTCLAIAAFKAVRKGRSVRDAQARLSTLAIVAESFESPAWGTDARDVDTLFAERRGEPTRRIALVKQADGKGRKYKQLVVPKEHVERAPTTEEFLARKTRLGMGESQVQWHYQLIFSPSDGLCTCSKIWRGCPRLLTFHVTLRQA